MVIMDPNQPNIGQGVQQQNVPNNNPAEMGYQYQHMPQMQNILGPPINTFVPGYNVMSQGQGQVMPQGPGTVMTNIQTGIPVSGFLSIGHADGSGPLPSMGSFIASLNQQSQIVHSMNKGENWTGQNNNTLPSFGHFLLHQQYQQQPANQQTLMGNHTSPQQQILTNNQQSSQVFSPNQHSPHFFQQSPQQQMFTTNQHSPQQVFINSPPSAQFFQNPQHSPQFFNSTIQPQIYSGQPSPHQLFQNVQPSPQQMFNACQLQNRFPAGQIVGHDLMPQVMSTQRMNPNTNYISNVNNMLGASTAQMLPPINQLISSSAGHVLPSVGNILHGQTLPPLNHMISPYSGQISGINTSSGQMLMPNSVSTVLTSPNVTSGPQLINVYSDRSVPYSSSCVVPCCNHVTITTTTITTTTVSRSTTEAVTANVHLKSSTSPKVSSTVLTETKHEKSQTTKPFTNTDSRTVIVPFGWSRVVVDNSIIYYSPSNVPLKSPMDIAKYLTTEGTCKCGLECPILINKVFNFDIGILSKMWTLDIDYPEDLTKLCNHKRKMIAMATFHTNYSVSSSTDTVSVNTLTGGIPSTTSITKTKTDLKKKTKTKTAKPGPYDGLLVSQLIAQRDKNKQTDAESLKTPNNFDTTKTKPLSMPESIYPISKLCHNTTLIPEKKQSHSTENISPVQSNRDNISLSDSRLFGTQPNPHKKVSEIVLESECTQSISSDKCENSASVQEENSQHMCSDSSIERLTERVENKSENGVTFLNVNSAKEAQKEIKEMKEANVAMTTDETEIELPVITGIGKEKEPFSLDISQSKSLSFVNCSTIDLTMGLADTNTPTTGTFSEAGHADINQSTDVAMDTNHEISKTIPNINSYLTIQSVTNTNRNGSALPDLKSHTDSSTLVSSGTLSQPESKTSTTECVIDIPVTSKTSSSSANESYLATLNIASKAENNQQLSAKTGAEEISQPSLINAVSSSVSISQQPLNAASSMEINQPNKRTETTRTLTSITTTNMDTSNVQTRTADKKEGRDLKISVDNTIVTSILSSINSVKSHEPVDKKRVSPKSTHKTTSKTQKSNSFSSNHSSQKSPKPPGSYDSFPLYQLPQMRYPLNHGIIPPVSGTQLDPYGINPFTTGHPFLTSGLFNFSSSPYPLLGEPWLDPKKVAKKKFPKVNKKEKVKKKVNCVYDSDTPPPNVDVSQLKDHGKGPIPKVSTSVSFLDDPAAFLAEQTVLISSSLKKSDKNSPVKDDKNDTVDGDVKTSAVSSTVNKSAKVASSVSMTTPFSFTSASHGMVVTSSTSLSKVGSVFNKHWGIPIPITESHALLGCSESEMFTEDRCESLSPDSGNECPSVNEMITPSSVVHHTANKQSADSKPESQLDKNQIKNNKILDILSNAKKEFASNSPSKKKTSVSKNVSLSLPQCSSITKSFPNRSAIQQALGNANTHEFPASTLLSAAARAQMAQQNYLNFVNPTCTQTLLQVGNQTKTTNVADNLTLVSADGSSFLVTHPNLSICNTVKAQGSRKTPVTQSDIVSGHESVAKLLRQPVNLNVMNTFKGIECIGNISEKSSVSAVTSSAVSSTNSKSVESVPCSLNTSNTVPVLSNITGHLPHILPNLTGLPQNLCPPLLNVIGSNIGMNLLSNGQVLLPEQPGIAISQGNIQCIPTQTSTLVTVDSGTQNCMTSGVNFSDCLQNKGTVISQLLPTASQHNLVHMKSPDISSNTQNMPKMTLNCDQILQQQNIQSNNSQMLLMPNLHMPLMQFLGSNSMPVNVGLDKIPQLCNPGDLQLHMGLSQISAPLNVMNVQQQVWNNLNTGNLTAMQIQTLQLQQQLLQQIQQLQDMQSIISQFSIQSNTTPLTTVANRELVMGTKENPVPGKCTPETMVSIVSTTCQESPGNGEEEESNSEEKGTSTDFNEDDDNLDYYDANQDEGEITSGNVADTTCSNDNNSIDVGLLEDDVEDESLMVGQYQTHGVTEVLNCESGASSIDRNVTDSLCHIFNEPVNLVSKTKHSENSVCTFEYTSSSDVASSSTVLSSLNSQSKCSVTTKQSTGQKLLKFSPEHSTSIAEKPSVASLPSELVTASVTTTTQVLPINLSRQTRNAEKPNVCSKEVNDLINLSQKRCLEEEIDVTDDISESVSLVKDIHDFTIGDLVWGQIRGFPSWPGKVVHESEVYDAEELEPGKCWVKWFGDHTFTQVEMLKLKTLTEGLEGHQKSKKRNKKGRKMNSNLEAAIHEALIELDKQNSLQMEMRLKPKGKIIKKKKVK